MADSQNISGFLLSGILAVINIILGFVVFPLKKQVDSITRELASCQKVHTAHIEGIDRDIKYIKRDADKAEAAAKAFSECLAEIREKVGDIKFATEANASSIKDIKGLVDTLPERIVDRIAKAG